ncbi:unnamed protein product [Arctogadus glacialis]
MASCGQRERPSVFWPVVRIACYLWTKGQYVEAGGLLLLRGALWEKRVSATPLLVRELLVRELLVRELLVRELLVRELLVRELLVRELLVRELLRENGVQKTRSEEPGHSASCTKTHIFIKS